MPRQTVSTSRPTPSHLGKGSSSRFVEPRSGQSGEYTSPYSSPPPASSARGGEHLVQFPHECLPVEPDLEDAGTIPQTAGSGYLPPHQADTGRMDAGKAYALRKGMANLDRRI